MSDSRLSRDDRSDHHSSSIKKSKKSKKSKSSRSRGDREHRSRTRSPVKSKKSKKDRKRSKSPKKSKKSRSGRGRSRDRNSRRNRRRDKKRGYRAVSSGSSSDDWKNTSDEDDSGSSRGRSSRSPKSKRHRGRSSRSRDSRSRSRSSSRSSSSSSYGRPPNRNGGYRGRNWRGGGRPPRGGSRRGGGFRPDAPTLRGRGYWRPNYIAYGRNIFPGGESSETHSDSSRSWSSSSSSRSATPEHYKDTPENSPPKQVKEKTPEKGLMDTIQQQEIERINNIMAQLDRAGKEAQQKHAQVRKGQFVGTFGAEKDIFDAEEAVPLRKEFKERADFAKEKQESNFPVKKKAKLFDYDDNYDKAMSLRKQMQQKENKDRQQIEEERVKQQMEQEQRIKNRAQSGLLTNENGTSAEEPVNNEIIARRRKSANIRSDLDNDEDDIKPDISALKKEPSDAEFVETLNASFEKERGHKIKIKGLSKSQPSFSELAAKMSKVGAGPMRGKVASSGLKSSGFGVPKILGRREANPENKFLKPNLKEHLESMDNQNDMLYKQKKQEEMEKQGELVQEQILSTAPLQSSNIGPIKPIVQTRVKGRATTGIVLPVNLINTPSPTTPTPSTPTSETGSSGSQVRAPSFRGPPGTPPVVLSVPPPGSSGWKEPKSGWNESPPRSQQTNQPVQKIHATPKVTLTRVQSELAPPPVIKRDYSNMPKMPQIVPIVHQYPNHPPPIPGGPPPVIHRVYNTPPPVVPFQHIQPKTKVILKREFDSDSEGPTPPPPGDVDLTQLYARHPQLWQGFVTIKKHAAMVQLHYLSGDKMLVQSVLPVFPTMTGSDNSKHPALKVTSRVRLEEPTFESLRSKMKETNKFTFLLGLPCGVSESDVEHQKNTLRVHFMQYFSTKSAAGVVEIKCDGVEYLVYMFPQCQLMHEQLSKCVDFAKQTSDLPQLMIAIFPSS